MVIVDGVGDCWSGNWCRMMNWFRVMHRHSYMGCMSHMNWLNQRCNRTSRLNRTWWRLWTLNWIRRLDRFRAMQGLVTQGWYRRVRSLRRIKGLCHFVKWPGYLLKIFKKKLLEGACFLASTSQAFCPLCLSPWLGKSS